MQGFARRCNLLLNCQELQMRIRKKNCQGEWVQEQRTRQGVDREKEQRAEGPAVASSNRPSSSPLSILIPGFTWCSLRELVELISKPIWVPHRNARWVIRTEDFFPLKALSLHVHMHLTCEEDDPDDTQKGSCHWIRNKYHQKEELEN
jgi:hypothetical protein